MYQGNVRIACQTFTWEMLGKNWTGGPDELLRAVSEGGYAGIEITDNMIGHYKDAPQQFHEALERHKLALVAIAISSESGFTTRSMMENDLKMADSWIEYIKQFPEAVLSIGSATAMSEGPREQMFDVASEFYNKVAAAGSGAGVSVAIHPSSHHNTLLFSREDYDYLFSMLDENVGWVPDTGHIIRGHGNYLNTLQAYQERIRYVHLKDVDNDGNWAMLGKGVCDIHAVLDIAKKAPFFNGWVVSEEESDYAGENPSTAVKKNRQTLKAMGY